MVVLPRLKLAFKARTVDGELRLASMDHADLYITNERNDLTNELLRGMPHSLLLSTSQGEQCVLVPAVKPVRPQVESEPFGTTLVLDRLDQKWHENVTTRTYMFAVHVSRSFLNTSTLSSALYVLVLKFLNRNYDAVAQQIEACSCDHELSAEETTILQCMGAVDESPDACASRARLSLVLLDSPNALPWKLQTVVYNYIIKLQHVSANCVLSRDDELSLLN
eukprot:1738822-Prymnesium_polylepis.1